MTTDPNILFRYTRGSRKAKIIVVAEYWGTQEGREKQPLMGESGKLLSRLLAESGIDESQLLFTSLISERPMDNDVRNFFYTNAEVKAGHHGGEIKGLYPKRNLICGLTDLHELIGYVKPELVIGLGNLTLWALTKDSFNITNQKGVKLPTGIASWRGSQLTLATGQKFLPIYSPTAALRAPDMEFALRHDLRARAARYKEWKEVERNLIVRPSYNTVAAYLGDIAARLKHGPVEITVDLETRANLIACAGIGISKMSAICIPFLVVEEPYSYWTFEEEFAIWEMLSFVLAHPNIQVIGQNFLYDAQYIYRYMLLKLKIHGDTLIRQHLIYPGTPLDLAYMASLYCENYVFWKDDGKEWRKDLNEEKLWAYNCLDCCNTFEIYEEQKKVIEYYKLQELLPWQMRQLNEILTIMIRGVRIHKDKKHESILDLLDHIGQVEHKLEQAVPEDVWPRNPKKSSWFSSTQQLTQLFTERLGMKPFYDRSARRYTMNENALQHYAGTCHPALEPLFEDLLEYRGLAAFQKFTQMKLDYDGRMRCEFTPTAETFRWKSRANVFGTGGNLQNLPTGDDERNLPNIRKQFIPDSGYYLIDVDLAGADAQAVAWDAKDEDLKDAFRRGLKVHIKNARDMWPEIVGDMTDDEIKSRPLYRRIKSGVHGTNYYGTAKGLAPRVGMSLRDTEAFQERWFYLHPAIKQWHNTVRAKLEGAICWNCDEEQEGGKQLCPHCGVIVGRTVKNAFGYRRIYFGRVDDAMLREALAWIAQSTVAINVVRGFILLVDTFPSIEILLQVHDSLLIQNKKNDRDIQPQIQKKLNSILTPYDDPLYIPWEMKTSETSWGDCK